MICAGICFAQTILHHLINSRCASISFDSPQLNFPNKKMMKNHHLSTLKLMVCHEVIHSMYFMDTPRSV